MNCSNSDNDNPSADFVETLLSVVIKICLFLLFLQYLAEH
jgi:hypothetical protein